jgi:hypothetical protein
MTTDTPTKPSLENIMFRVTPKLKEKVAATAQSEQVSQNTLMTASLFLSNLAWGKLPVTGPPKNIFAFLAEAERAAELDDLAYGGYNVTDWEQIEPFIQGFADFGFIKEYQHRSDSASQDTVAYRFRFTRLGLDALPLVATITRVFLEVTFKQDDDRKNRPTMKSP